MTKQAVIIVSGGLDSVTLLHKLVKEDGYKPEDVLAITFYYGQRHEKEIFYAIWQCDKLGVEHKTIDLSDFMKDFQSALTGHGNIPHIKEMLGDPQPVSYVPFRNQLFLTITCGIAESVGATTVYYGAQLHDLYGYWDCTEEFITQFNNLITLNRKNIIKLKAPFIYFTKAQTAQKALDLKIDLSHTWSCYNGREKACGTCPTCAERRKAFREIGREDPIQYENT
jgi:7-cyano-7-deazaguanine synthase